MSLETDIQNLTKAIEALASAISKAPKDVNLFVQGKQEAENIAKQIKEKTATKTEKTTKALETIEETEVEQNETPKTYKFEELQSACAALVKKDLANKTKIKKVLDSFKAEILRDLKESEYADFMAQLGNI